MTDPTWVFGYGSLMWRQDFPYLDSRRAHIQGWTRRFWQGSHDHRGIATDPGRVVTLVEAPGDRCYGRAFLVEPGVFEHLDYREKNGYQRFTVDTFFDDAQAPGIVYIADETNFAFLGDAPPHEIAAQIHRCAGPSGTNIEYVLELAHILRRLEIPDPHVFQIETLVLAAQNESGLL
jgi:cation transport regulator ChaC